jgi:hypothetical protein
MYPISRLRPSPGAAAVIEDEEANLNIAVTSAADAAAFQEQQAENHRMATTCV